MYKRLLTLILLLYAGLSTAQYNPSFFREVVVQNTAGISANDYAALVIFDTQTEIGAGNMLPTGADIRFFEAEDSCRLNRLDYWIEKDLNTANTYIWVRIPSLAAGAIDTLAMYYGDPNAIAASDFTATFPSAIINPGNLTLGGTQYVSWFELGPTDTITIVKDSILDFRGGKVVINGHIEGEGRGFGVDVSGVATGLGPGGGTAGSSSGAGGGSYGGLGGDGGYDASDPINGPGPIYGTVSGFDIAPGSAGGNASSVYGGNGGGAVSFQAYSVDISGSINVNGAEAEQPGGGQGAGGGSGGGAAVLADVINFTGSITADGGGGSIGTSTANDDGGGGGGGRIKFLYGSSINNTGTTSVAGGPVGPNGSTPPQPGNPGTIHSGTVAYPAPTVGAAVSGTYTSPPTTSIVASVCDSFVAPNGQVFTTSGFYSYTAPAGGGCDSLIDIDLTVNYSSTATINPVVCDSYTAPDGQVYTTSGTYIASLTGTGSCDSVITINLTVNNSDSSTINPVVCDSYVAPDGQVYTSSGTYTALIPTAQGCDSTITINLTVNNSSATVISQVACNSFVAPNGQLLTISGQYNIIYTNAVGCDSVVTLNLTVNNSSSSSISETACDSYTAPDGQSYTSSGTYAATIPNSEGCDSTITIDLTILNSTSSSISETACSPYTAPDGQVFTATGVYTATLTNAVGCDSIITIDLTIENDATVTVSNLTLTAVNSNASYQWLDCTQGNAPILNATSQSFTAPQPGIYAVEVTAASGCIDTSDCIMVPVTGVVENPLESIQVFPNPSNGQIQVDFGGLRQSFHLQVYTATGQLLLERHEVRDPQTSLELKGPAGSYFLRIEDEDGHSRTVVLIKR